jgi:hypothetical protein
MEVLAEEPEVVNEEVLEEEPVLEVTEEAVASEPEEQEVVEELMEVTVGEEAEESLPPEEDSSVIRNLRKNTREQAKKLKEQEKMIADLKGPVAGLPTLGEKPTLEGSDYDADKFSEALEDWHNQKRAHEDEKAKVEVQEKEAQKAWQTKVEFYEEAKSKLKVAGFEEAEDTAKTTLDENQQGIIVQCATDPALMVYAIGKDPERAEKFSKIKNYAEFAFKLGQLEKDLKVSKKTTPPPERTVKGSAPKSGTSDSTLDKLRAEADKTGDYNKVMQYKRNKAKQNN